MFGKIRHVKTEANTIASGHPEPVTGDGPAQQETTPPALTGTRETVFSAEQVDQVIMSTEQLMALPVEDLSFADGKIDTRRAQDWLDKAAGLLAVSKDVFARGNYSQAVAYAQAAGTIAEMADLLMAQALGTEKLSAYTKSRPDKEVPSSADQDTQLPHREQVRSELLQIYDEIVLRDSLPAFVEARAYLTEAMTAYKVAYDAYVDGSYRVASDENRLARGMLQVADSIVNATTTAT